MELRHLAIARLATLVIASLVIALSPGWLPSAWALSIGQQDNFEDGTTQGWVVALGGAAHPRPPVNIPSGGPTGAGDNFLFLTALGGQGPGSRLTVINVSQWTGDFIAAGISGVRMDLINLGPTDLNLRLLFSDESAGPPQNLAFSTTPFEAKVASPAKPKGLCGSREEMTWHSTISFRRTAGVRPARAASALVTQARRRRRICHRCR